MKQLSKTHKCRLKMLFKNEVKKERKRRQEKLEARRDVTLVTEH